MNIHQINLRFIEREIYIDKEELLNWKAQYCYLLNNELIFIEVIFTDKIY